MACIEKIYSVSALVGEGVCNAKCDFCAATNLRSQAKSNGERYWSNLESAIKLSARYGGWSLSLTGSGEPTCSPKAVTKALKVYAKCASQGAWFPNVNLFTNGILLGNAEFCDRWLPAWKQLGLTNIAISIHSPVPYRQAEVYGVNEYPPYSQIIKNVKRHGVGARCTLLLRRGGVDNGVKYRHAIHSLICDGFDNFTSWPVGNPDGSRNEFTPSRTGLLSIRWWLRRNAILCHGHSWGGGVYDYRGNILRITDYVTRHGPKKDFVRQLVVFQDGTVAYSWIREGALCMK